MSETKTEGRIRRLKAAIRKAELTETARLPGDTGRWTRRREMPLEDMLYSTLGKQGLSTVMEIQQYFQDMGKTESEITKQAYLRQRKKLNPRVFKVLNRNYLQWYYEGDEAKTWQGYIVLAVDGSRVEIPDSAENRETYGESENKYGKGVARANVSVAYDVNNRFLLDIQTDHYRGSEIQEAKAHLAGIREILGDRPALIIFDRNYVSMEFMDILEQSGIKYLIRLRKSDYQRERAQLPGGDGEAALEYTKNRLRQLRKEDPERAAELEQGPELRVRILMMKFGGEAEGALITNLGNEYRAQDIRRLYRKRWKIEQHYHTLKNKMKFESVTGKASIYVEQDFWAQTLVYNILQDLISEAEREMKRAVKKKGYRYEMRINENIAIGLFKKQFIRLMAEEDREEQDRLFDRMKTHMKRNIVPVRPSPNSPRRWQYFNKYKCNQKPSF